MPLLEGQRHDKVTDEVEIARHLRRLAADAQLVGVFQYQRQQPGRGLAAQDRATVTRCQQRRDAPNMVEMDMGDDQGLNTLDIKSEGGGFCTGRRITSLFQPAVDQQTGGWAEVQLVTGPGDTPGTTVMGKAGIFHAAHTRLDRK